MYRSIIIYFFFLILISNHWIAIDIIIKKIYTSAKIQNRLNWSNLILLCWKKSNFLSRTWHWISACDIMSINFSLNSTRLQNMFEIYSFLLSKHTQLLIPGFFFFHSIQVVLLKVLLMMLPHRLVINVVKASMLALVNVIGFVIEIVNEPIPYLNH